MPTHSHHPAPVASVIFLYFAISLLPYESNGQLEVFVSVEGEVTKPGKFTIEMLFDMPTVEINVPNGDGGQDTYSGVRISDILIEAGVTLGPDLREKNLAKYLLVQASDGYEAIFSLPEIDPEFTDQISMVAYAFNGEPLPAGMGPFRIIIPHEKRQGRWVREVKALKIHFADN